MMTDRETATIHRIVVQPRIENHTQAAKMLDDTPYLAWCMIVAMKHFIALICKRWPNLG